jgi:hypothetical protein
MKNILNFNNFIFESNRNDYIKKYCKPAKPVEQIPMYFKDIYKYLLELKKYPETLKCIDKGEAVIVSIRRKLETRKDNPEKYIDSIYFIPKNAKKQNSKIVPFQATTVPSVAWYNTEVAILDDIEYRFKIGTHKFDGLGKTIPALVPDTKGLGPKEINVKRFSDKDEEVKTFDPPKKDLGKGTNFHYGLVPKGVKSTKEIPCVGGWSAGCQVIPTEEKWNEFWELVKSSGQQIFWYSIIEEDKIK